MKQDLMLWPGWGMQPASWAPFIAALPEGWTAHTPDISVLARPSLAEWGAALAPTISTESVLLGWSLGAQLALAAVAAGARPRGMFLIAATPCFAQNPDWPHALPTATVSQFVADFASQPAPTLQRFLALQAVGDARRTQVLAALKPALVNPATPNLAPALNALVEGDLRHQLHAVNCPVQLVHGAGDALMPPAAAQWLVKHLPDARLDILPDCGHAPHISNPAALAATLTRFVETLP